MKDKKTAFKKNQILTVEIEDITDLGFGVGRFEGMVVFVADTVFHDIVEVKIIKVNSSYLVGRVEKFIKKSEMRVDTRCKNCQCKSCAYKNISYKDECICKEEKVRHIFATNTLSHIKTEKIVPSPKEFSYRNKAQYPVELQNGEYTVGFFAPKSHRVTKAEDCPIAPKVFTDIINTLKDYFKKEKISVYDENSGEGLLRHIYLRRGEVSCEILLTLVINGEKIPNEKELVSLMTERFPQIVGILLNQNCEKTNVILGEKYRILFGRDFIFDTLSGVNLKITAPSFYQVNHSCAELLYAKAKELAELEESDTLLDLYCGAGSIGLSMAKEVKELIGIEIVESAVLCARENAERNGINNAKFYTGDAVDVEKMLKNAEKERGSKILPSVVILDPPRSGCAEKLCEFVSSLNPRKIVYISCNPKTLARDVEVFEKLGYRTHSVTPFDMFPATGHVESILALERA